VESQGAGRGWQVTVPDPCVLLSAVILVIAGAATWGRWLDEDAVKLVTDVPEKIADLLDDRPGHTPDLSAIGVDLAKAAWFGCLWLPVTVVAAGVLVAELLVWVRG
jgi:hypothetical protein